MTDYDGLTVIVTGASSGLGRAICVEVAARGADAVVVNYASNSAGADETASAVEQAGAKAMVVQGDVGEPEDCKSIVAALKSYGRADVLFNNAGVTTFSPDHGSLESVTADDFARIYRTNVIGAYQMITAARPLLSRAAGTAAIVNTASVAGIAGIGSSLPYACSKGALITMTVSLARSLAPGIRVNAICPGFMDTPWYMEALTPDELETRRATIAATTPLKVVSRADDVAAAAVFLGSPAARHVTGETLMADAGMHLGFSMPGAR